VDGTLKRVDSRVAMTRGAVAAKGDAVTELPTNAAKAFPGVGGRAPSAIASTPDMSRYAGGTLVPSTNGFITAVRIAYNEHAPLRLRADDVWLQVRQVKVPRSREGRRRMSASPVSARLPPLPFRRLSVACVQIVWSVATHVDLNAERLRRTFVTHDGKKPLVVLVPPEWEGVPDERVPWESAVATFTSLIRRNTVAAVADAFEPHFTTTDATAVAACSVTLMSAMQKYFDYRMMTMCGIHSVLLEGEPADWTQLRARVRDLAATTGLREELAAWWALLDGDLAQLEASAHGRSDAAWWKRMINLYEPGGSGSVLCVNGWVTHFFLYDKDKRPIDHAALGDAPADKRGDSRRSAFSGMAWDDLPAGYGGAPVVWQLLSGAERQLLFMAGSWYAAMLPDGTVAPAMQWLVAERR